MKKTVLRKYAQLIARSGVNIQKGQEVIIRAGLDQPEFIRILVEECYRAGASKVTVEWDYLPLTKLHVRYRSAKVLSRVETWEEEKMRHQAKTLPCTIRIESEDPDGLKGVNQEKMMNAQRKIIYGQRNRVLSGEDVQDSIRSMIEEFIRDSVGTVDPRSPEELEELLSPFYPLLLYRNAIPYSEHIKCEDIRAQVQSAADKAYERKAEELGLMPDGTPLMRELERVILLRVVDEYWMDHIDAMSELRKGIGLRGYGNVNPVDAYRQEGFDIAKAS